MAENAPRLADKIPLLSSLDYTAIERVAPELAINVVSRFTDLDQIQVTQPVQDVQRFLDFLQNFDNIVALGFYCNQPQDLFDRLPEHCAVQSLAISSGDPDFRFLSRLESLIFASVYRQIGVDLVQRVFEELQFVSSFKFHYKSRKVVVEIDPRKRFKVSAGYIGIGIAMIN